MEVSIFLHFNFQSGLSLLISFSSILIPNLIRSPKHWDFFSVDFLLGTFKTLQDPLLERWDNAYLLVVLLNLDKHKLKTFLKFAGKRLWKINVLHAEDHKDQKQHVNQRILKLNPNESKLSPKLCYISFWVLSCLSMPNG